MTRLYKIKNSKRKGKLFQPTSYPTIEVQSFFTKYAQLSIEVRTAYLKPCVYPPFYYTTQPLVTLWDMIYYFILTLKSICKVGEAMARPYKSISRDG